jgi:hypothetical protein
MDIEEAFTKRHELVASGSAGRFEDPLFAKSYIRELTGNSSVSKKWAVDTLTSLEALLKLAEEEPTVIKPMMKKNELNKKRPIYPVMLWTSCVECLMFKTLENCLSLPGVDLAEDPAEAEVREESISKFC